MPSGPVPPKDAEATEGLLQEAAQLVPTAGAKHLKHVRVEKRADPEEVVKLLEGLSQSRTVETLDFRERSHIPAAAWQKLRGARWPNLKVVWLNSQLGTT